MNRPLRNSWHNTAWSAPYSRRVVVSHSGWHQSRPSEARFDMHRARNASKLSLRKEHQNTHATQLSRRAVPQIDTTNFFRELVRGQGTARPTRADILYDHGIKQMEKHSWYPAFTNVQPRGLVLLYAEVRFFGKCGQPELV